MLLLALRAPSFFAPPVAGFLFENHWTWWAGGVVLGGVLWYLAGARADLRMLRAGQVILAVTVLWVLAALAVDSPAERLHAAHVDLAAAVEKADVQRVFTYFEPHFTVPALGIRGDELVAARDQLGVILKQYGIKESHITVFHATMNGDGTAVTLFTVLTLSDMGPIKSTWQLSWNDEPGVDWRIVNAALLKLQDQAFPKDGMIR